MLAEHPEECLNMCGVPFFSDFSAGDVSMKGVVLGGESTIARNSYISTFGSLSSSS
jgi:hypothetical protein